VPLVQMNALMGFVHDAINATILGFDIPDEAKAKAIRSFSKLLWIQNDLITRHYAPQNGMAPSSVERTAPRLGAVAHAPNPHS
jgi:hypothetical protein